MKGSTSKAVMKHAVIVAVLLCVMAGFNACSTADGDKTSVVSEDGVMTQAFILRQPHELDTADIKKITGAYQELTSFDVPPDFPPHGFWLKFEGPTWENDHVGYRFYCDTRHRFDIFGKRTSKPVLDTVGLDYHEIQPWGSDILKVGSTFGIGSPALLIEDSIYFLEEWNRKVIRAENTGSSSRAIAEFEGLSAGGHQFDLVQTLEIFPGNPFTLSSIEVKPGTSGLDYQVVTGIVNHEEAEADLQNTGGLTVLSTYGKQSYHGNLLGMAIAVPEKYSSERGYESESHTLVIQPRDNEVEYYFMADWELGVKGSMNLEEFERNLKKYVDNLSSRQIETEVR